MGPTEKIRIFAWHLHTHSQMTKFRTRDITGCFDQLHLHRPANASQLLSSMVGRDLIKDGDGFRVAKPVRDAFDAKYQEREETVVVDTLLSSLPAKLSDAAQQDYLREALVCFRHKAFRAAVVMTWNVVYDHLVTLLSTKYLAPFNTQLAGMFGGKRKPVAAREDFQKLKESEVIEVCQAANLVSKEVGKVLNDKLEKRNSAAHPSGSIVDKLQAEAYIS